MTERLLSQVFELQRFARNPRLQAVIDYWRRARPAEELPEELSDDALPEDGLIQQELLEGLADALERLPDELTDIIVLHYGNYYDANERRRSRLIE